MEEVTCGAAAHAQVAAAKAPLTLFSMRSTAAATFVCASHFDTATTMGTSCFNARSMHSSVCGMTPSSAAMTRTTTSVACAPRARICTARTHGHGSACGPPPHYITAITPHARAPTRAYNTAAAGAPAHVGEQLVPRSIQERNKLPGAPGPAAGHAFGGARGGRLRHHCTHDCLLSGNERQAAARRTSACCFFVPPDTSAFASATVNAPMLYVHARLANTHTNTT